MKLSDFLKIPLKLMDVRPIFPTRENFKTQVAIVPPHRHEEYLEDVRVNLLQAETDNRLRRLYPSADIPPRKEGDARSAGEAVLFISPAEGGKFEFSTMVEAYTYPLTRGFPRENGKCFSPMKGQCIATLSPDAHSVDIYMPPQDNSRYLVRDAHGKPIAGLVPVCSFGGYSGLERRYSFLEVPADEAAGWEKKFSYLGRELIY